MASRVNVTVGFKATDADKPDPDNKFFELPEMTWYGVPLSQFVEMERLLLEMQLKLNEIGERHAQGKSGGSSRPPK